MSIEELKNKAEEAWVDCDGCSQDDKQMWINGYLAGALSNQIKLPSNEEIEKQLELYASEDYIIGKRTGMFFVITYIKQQDDAS